LEVLLVVRFEQEGCCEVHSLWQDCACRGQKIETACVVIVIAYELIYV
jgi:hypothetical protein